MNRLELLLVLKDEISELKRRVKDLEEHHIHYQDVYQAGCTGEPVFQIGGEQTGEIMTVKKIIADYLKQNGFDGLHSHAENNNYGGCGCGIKKMFACQECIGDCEPAYKHTVEECKKCPDYKECEPWETAMFCGKKVNK